MLKGLIRVGLLAGLAAVFALPTASASAATKCPATFQVLHNDRIGAMSVPAGAYYVSVNNLTCSQASTLFADFLEDYDGDLPFPWRGNAAAKSFSNGTSSFSVKLAGKSPPPPSGGGSSATCPGTFSVLHNDRIGNVSFPKGAYTMKLIRGLNCSSAATQFSSFLDSPSGVNAPWTLTGSASNAVFQDNMGGFGFSVSNTGGSTGGGGRTAVTCTTFRVLHNDHIGSLYLPKGTYDIVLPVGSTMSCAAAQRQFTTFLNAASVPRPWIVNADSATFARGAGSSTTFGVDPTKGSIR